MYTAFSFAVLGLPKCLWIPPANERMGCPGDKLFLVLRIILMRIRKTVEVPAWASRFNIPFFYFPVSATSSDCSFNRRIIIKNKYNPA